LIFYFLIGVALLATIWMILRWATTVPPAVLATAVRYVAIGAGAIAVAYMLATGRGANALFLGLMLLPFLGRWKAMWNRMRGPQGPAAGQSSTVDTALLRMTLDHDSGAMDGLVLGGAFKGRKLSELGLRELLDLLAEARLGDPDAAQLVETYLDRAQPDWRGAQGQASGMGEEQAPYRAASAAMTRDEAWRILRLDAGASAEEIRAAHRRLMLKLHPDQGGSDYLAAKINQAKDLLLGT